MQLSCVVHLSSMVRPSKSIGGESCRMCVKAKWSNCGSILRAKWGDWRSTWTSTKISGLLFVLIYSDPFHSRAPIASSVVLNTGSNQHLGTERVWLVRLHHHCAVWCISCLYREAEQTTDGQEEIQDWEKGTPTKDFCLYGNKADCVHVWPQGEGTQAEDEEGSQGESKVQKSVLCNLLCLFRFHHPPVHAHTQPYFPELKKDPGIPNLYPFKEQLLKQIEEKKVRAEEERERQKRQRQREQAKRRSLQGLQNDARKRTKDFEKRVSCWERRRVRGVC